MATDVDLEGALRRVMRRRRPHARALEELDEDRDKLIREMIEQGSQRKLISDITGLSRQRIDQIRRGARL